MKPRLERFILLLLFVALIPAGYWMRFRAPVSPEIRDASGGAIYVALWVVFAALFATRARAWKIAGAVTLVTCVLEFLQRWHPRWLEALRATFPGRVILGTTFGWDDFPPYFVGGLLGWLILSAVRKWPVSA